MPSAAAEVVYLEPDDRTTAKRDTNDGRVSSEDLACVVNHDHPLAVRLFLALLSLSKYSVWSCVVADGASRILSISPRSRISTALLPILIPNSSLNAVPLLASPPQVTFAISAIAIILGWRIRKSCFDTLGRHFTFTHTTLRKHTLVTEGPYGVVRHPGYVGMFLVRLGGLGILLARGGWVRTVGAVPWPLSRVMAHRAFDSVDSPLVGVAKLVIGVYALHTVLEQIALLGVRAPREDATLRDRFGAEWRAYKGKVPWMFVPHII